MPDGVDHALAPHFYRARPALVRQAGHRHRPDRRTPVQKILASLLTALAPHVVGRDRCHNCGGTVGSCKCTQEGR